MSTFGFIVLVVLAALVWSASNKARARKKSSSVNNPSSGTGKDVAAGTEYRLINCPNEGCGARIRLPKNHGRLSVVCPKCKCTFFFDSSSDFAVPQNELLSYRKGGTSRVELPDANSCTDLVLLRKGLVAAWVGSMLVNNILDKSSVLWRDKKDIKLDYVTFSYDETSIHFNLYVNGAAQAQTLSYTYNEAIEDNGAPIHMDVQKQQWMRAATLSRVADVSNAIMANGRIYG